MRHTVTGLAEDADSASAAWREAATLLGVPPAQRLTASRRWAVSEASRGEWATAEEAFTVAIDSLPLVAYRGLGRQSREVLVHEGRGLAGEGAASAVTNGNRGRAVELLELGRAVLWAQLLDLRTELNSPAEVAPGLAARLAAVRAQLEGPVELETSAVDPKPI
jgi:hypothetical protein